MTVEHLTKSDLYRSRSVVYSAKITLILSVAVISANIIISFEYILHVHQLNSLL